MKAWVEFWPTLVAQSVIWARMFRLVDAEFAATGKRQGGEASPPLFAHSGDRHVLRSQISRGRGDIVAHEKEFVASNLLVVAFVAIVECGFGVRQGKDQPAVASIDVRKFKHVAKEDPIRFWIVGVQDDVGAVDHGRLSLRRSHRLTAQVSLQVVSKNPTAWESLGPRLDRLVQMDPHTGECHRSSNADPLLQELCSDLHVLQFNATCWIHA